MRCKRVRDFIMTNYIDAELSDSLKKRIDKHLLSCDGCREFEKSIRERVVMPFKEAQQVEPPEEVWSNIKEAITSEKEYKESALDRLRENLREIFARRNTVLAFATVTTIILIAVIFTKMPFNGRRATNNYLQDQIDFLTYLDMGEQYYADNGYINLDTSIEEYFL